MASYRRITILRYRIEAQLLPGSSALGFVVKILLSLQITLAGILLVPHRLGGASALPDQLNARPWARSPVPPSLSAWLKTTNETHSRLHPRDS